MERFTRLEFDKKIQSLMDQSEMLSRIVKARNADELLEKVLAEGKRLGEESKTVNREAKIAGYI